MEDYLEYDTCAPSKPSRQEEIGRELAAKHKCDRYCFSFTNKKEKITESILRSEYFPNLQETLYFYRNNLD